MHRKLAQFSHRALLPVVGLALTLGAVGVMATSAEAKPRWPKDAGARCTLTDPNTGYIDFFMPGAKQYRGDSTHTYELTCAQDGSWVITHMATD
jgi:hypothetical protein